MDFNIIADQSKQKLKKFPDSILSMTNLKMLYLERNFIEYIPVELFTNLKKLSWLDLRNNRLRYIPKSIAYHENLENLLISNNCLETLPNELGLVPKLTVLQVSENPLVYPCRSIITNGTQSICAYLRAQYLSQISKENISNSISECHNDIKTSPISLQTDISSEDSMKNKSTNTIQDPVKFKKTKKRMTYSESTPIITVTRLSKPKEVVPKTATIPTNTSSSSISRPKDLLVHEFTKGVSDISVKSYYKKNTPSMNVASSTVFPPFSAELKEQWLEKVKLILTEQERILQQEKNVMALKEWRNERRLEATRKIDREDLPKPPYDTQRKYMKMASRSDLANMKYINESEEDDNEVPQAPSRVSNMSIQNVIAKLAGQLEELEGTTNDAKSSTHDIEDASQQFKTIMKIYHQIQRLQGVNDKLL